MAFPGRREKNHSKRNTFQQLHENSKHCMKFSNNEMKSFNNV